VLFHYNPARGRPITEARPVFEKALTLGPRDAPLTHLLEILAIDGDYATFASLLPGIEPGAHFHVVGQLVRALTRGSEEEVARALAEARLQPDPELASTARHALFLLRDRRAAERVVRLLTEPGAGAPPTRRCAPPRGSTAPAPWSTAACWRRSPSSRSRPRSWTPRSPRWTPGARTPPTPPPAWSSPATRRSTPACATTCSGSCTRAAATTPRRWPPPRPPRGEGRGATTRRGRSSPTSPSGSAAAWRGSAAARPRRWRSCGAPARPSPPRT
jgi:hypothetical protein